MQKLEIKNISWDIQTISDYMGIFYANESVK